MKIKLATAPAASSDTGPTVSISGPAGQCRAIFSRFNVVDSDGDVTLPGAFVNGTPVVLSAYGHTSWTGALPVGRAVIQSDAEKAWADVQFLLSTQAGRETFEVVRDLGSLCQWSYGYTIDKASHGPAPDGSGQTVQFLEALTVFEISPVLVGAGVQTGTEDDSIKADVIREYLRFQRLAVPTPDPDDERAQALVDHEFARFVRDGLDLAR